MSLGYRLLPEQAHIYFVPSDRELMGKERVDSIHQCLLVLLMDLERYFSIILLSAAGKFEPFIHSFMVSASKVDRTHYKAIYNHNSKTILLGSRIYFTVPAERKWAIITCGLSSRQEIFRSTTSRKRPYPLEVKNEVRKGNKT